MHCSLQNFHLPAVKKPKNAHLPRLHSKHDSCQQCFSNTFPNSRSSPGPYALSDTAQTFIKYSICFHFTLISYISDQSNVISIDFYIEIKNSVLYSLKYGKYVVIVFIRISIQEYIELLCVYSCESIKLCSSTMFSCNFKIKWQFDFSAL